MKTIATFIILAGVASLSMTHSALAHDLKHTHKKGAHTHDHHHDGQAHMEHRHGKTSAPVQFGHKVEQAFTVGRFSDVIVTAQGDGVSLSLSANATPGLEVGSITELPQASGEAPSWRIAVRPTSEGVHYLNLFGVTDQRAKDLSDVRVQSIRIDLGGQGKEINASQKPIMIESETGGVAVFKARETIRSKTSDD